MPATYEPIATSSPSAASSVTFSSISGTFTDLLIVSHLTASTTSTLYLRLNSDTGSNYSTTWLQGDGSSAGSVRLSNQTAAVAGGWSYGLGTSNRNVLTHNVMSYANTNVFTTVLGAYANAGAVVERNVSLWRSTAAVTSLELYPGTGTITGTVSLYGIKAA